MKIVRKKNGFTIRCNDGEFEMLEQAVADLNVRALRGNGKNAHTRRTKGGPVMRIDADKRGDE